MTRRAWLLFLAMCLLWGVPYLFIKVAVAQVSPVWVVFARTGVAALVLLPVALRRGALRGLRGTLPAVAALALMEMAGPFLLISFGEQRIPSSLTGLLIAAVPLVTALLALRVDPSERVDGLRLVGLAIGFGGVVALLGLEVGTAPGQVLGAGMVLLATCGYAGGALLIKRSFADVPALGVVTSALLITTLLLVPAAVATAPARLPDLPAVLALAALGVACTAVALLVFFALIAAAGASRATVITYVNPAVAVALGVAVLAEPVTAATVAGFLLIVAGSWLSTGGTLPPRALAGLRRLRRRERAVRETAAVGPARPPLPAR